jgi:hypothetical protein
MLSPRNPAGRGGGDAKVAAPLQGKIQFQAVAAGDDGAVQIGQARELDHGIDDLLAVWIGWGLWIGVGLNHLALLNDGCSAAHATRRG